MTIISHYEIYTDNGKGWQLQERFAMDQRQDAYQLAKEREAAGDNVKIIKENFETFDNTYSETVEYISSRNVKKATRKTLSKIDYQKSSNEVVQDIADSRRNVYKAIIKLIALILVSLVFANIFVTLLFPILEIFVGEDNNSLLFFVFFTVFLAMAVPLVLKNIPWYIFISTSDNTEKEIAEEKFYSKANGLITAYNINSDLSNIKANAYPEAPLEYKHYLIYFLSEILSNLNIRTALQSQFSRFGVKLLVFGGCLELGRYGNLTLNEANSILLDAFKIIDGDNADLEKFYEAKQSYQDNKLAIYLTGVGAYMMHQIITDQKLSSKLLTDVFTQWEAQKNPAVQDNGTKSAETTNSSVQADNGAAIYSINIKSDLKFLDENQLNQEDTATKISSAIHNIITDLSNKYDYTNITEADGITTIDCKKIRDGAKFAIQYLKDISEYIEENSNEKIVLRNCCAMIKKDTPSAVTPAALLRDMFEHVYNNEIISTKDIAILLEADGFEVEFLGDKQLKESNQSTELYKIKY